MAKRILTDPHLEVCLNCAGAEYDMVRGLIVANSNVMQDEATRNLVKVWTAGLLARKAAWNAQVAANQAAVDQVADEWEAARAQEEAERTATKVLVGMQQLDDDLGNAPWRKGKMADFNENKSISNYIVPCPVAYAMSKLKNYNYVELWYFTNEGCRDAQSHGRTTVEEALGLECIGSLLVLQPIAAVKASKNIMWDEDLMWYQMLEAKLTFLHHIVRAKWPERH
ncbi:hypothetical protein DXG03_002592, partial [Asterophora parasitica]